CKAAWPAQGTSSALQPLGARGVTARTRQLLSARHDVPAQRARLDALAAGMTALVIALAVALPAASVAGAAQSSHSTHTSAEQHCEH
ncbi:MAG: hypothetical protein ACRDKY_13840, partial [Solirubrobacteraceae bacterium]